MHCVCAFVYVDTVIVSQFPGECAVPGVDRVNFFCTMMEETIGEPADVAAEVGACES